MKVIAYLLLTLPLAAATDWPTGTRITPPTIRSVSPMGIARGATVELTIEGINLGGATKVYFNDPAVTGRILKNKELPDQDDVRLGSNGGVSTVDLGPIPPRHQLIVEVDVSPDAVIGPVDFRILTPLGSTPTARFLVEPYYGESPDREPNNTPEEAFETFLPTVLVGAISKPGDVDYFKITVRDQEEVVFENPSRSLGSQLTPVISIYDSEQKLVQEFREDSARRVTAFGYKFEHAGGYYIRISDAEDSGSAGHFYRIKAGKIPVVLSAFPLQSVLSFASHSPKDFFDSPAFAFSNCSPHILRAVSAAFRS